MARYALGPPDKGGSPTLVDLDAPSDTEVKLRFIELNDVENIEDYLPPTNKQRHKEKRGHDGLDYVETAEERAKRQRREASKRYYAK